METLFWERALAWGSDLVAYATIGHTAGGLLGYPWRHQVREHGIYQITGFWWGVVAFFLAAAATALRHERLAQIDLRLLVTLRGFAWAGSRANVSRLYRETRARLRPGAAWEAKRQGEAACVLLVL